MVKSVWFDPVPDAIPAAELREQKVAPALQLALAVTAIAVLVLGIFPGLIANVGDIAQTFAL